MTSRNHRPERHLDREACGWQNCGRMKKQSIQPIVVPSEMDEAPTPAFVQNNTNPQSTCSLSQTQHATLHFSAMCRRPRTNASVPSASYSSTVLQSARERGACYMSRITKKFLTNVIFDHHTPRSAYCVLLSSLDCAQL